MKPSELALYHVTRPPRGAGAGPHPALILLHGRGADELDLLGLAEDLDSRLFVISARAPMALGPGHHWYHLLDIGNPEPKSFASSLASLAQFVADLPKVYAIDPGAIVTLGFSQGSMMAGSLLLTQPSLVAGTVMLSGYLPLLSGLPIRPEELRGRPVFEAHGTVDPVIPVALGRQARDYWNKVGANLTYREYPIAHSIGSQELLEVNEWLAQRLATL